MRQVLLQHEYLKETARECQPLLSTLAEKKIHFPLFQKKGGKRKCNIHTVKSNYLTLVLTRNLTYHQSDFKFSLQKKTKQQSFKKSKILDLHKELPISSHHSLIRISSKLFQLLDYEKNVPDYFFYSKFLKSAAVHSTWYGAL